MQAVCSCNRCPQPIDWTMPRQALNSAGHHQRSPIVKQPLPVLALLLAAAACTAAPADQPQTAAGARPSQQAEDARLRALLAAAFEAQIAPNPQVPPRLGS